MSILDEYDSLKQKTEKEIILDEFQNINTVDVPAAYKAWVDIIWEFLNEKSNLENCEKALILDLLNQCNLNSRIYVRSYNNNPNTPHMVIIEPWIKPLRTKEYIESWINHLLSNRKLDNTTLYEFINGLLGGPQCSNIDNDNVDIENEYYAFPISFPEFTNWVPAFEPLTSDKECSKIQPIKSKYNIYKEHIYQLLEIYNIKKESD